MRIGIFFGGPSREREISFAGGRTVYDNLDKSLFQAVPVFVDSHGNFVLLDWQYLYKGTIRDFYPPVSALPDSEHKLQVYLESLGELSQPEQDRIIGEVGRRLRPDELAGLMDFAFLALHGPAGEDGAIQGLLEWYGIPYSGSGILPSAFGIDKIAQKTLIHALGLPSPAFRVLTADEFDAADPAALLAYLQKELGLPLVLKAPRQGSSIGVSILREADPAKFATAVERSLFRRTLTKDEWQRLGPQDRVAWAQHLTDIRDGIGLPVILDSDDEKIYYHPDELLRALDQKLLIQDSVRLTNTQGEQQVLVEAFVQGREFSCIVVEDVDGRPLALPPTEIVKGEEMFDYRSKYLPGLSRKITPIDLPEAEIQRIREQCEQLFRTFGFQVYARLDGFLTANGEIFLNDPNTTSGMLPASFFFHQAAEIGLNPSQFLTYLIRTSLAARRRAGLQPVKLGRKLKQLDEAVAGRQHEQKPRTKVAVIMGGYSSERHISVESGRNIYEKLSSSAKYQPVPVFLSGSSENYQLHVLPVNVMLKDNADDIRDKIQHYQAGHGPHPVLERIRHEATQITSTYAAESVAVPEQLTFEQLAERVDAVFIALHGRPGEDGALQQQLERVGLPYNGSGVQSSSITINKFETNKRLRDAGLRVAEHRLAARLEWEADAEQFYQNLEAQFPYPFIAKPADDGCSSAVKKLKTRAELEAFSRLIFRDQEDLMEDAARTLSLGFKEEFPRKEVFLVETLISREGARHFLEVTGGLLTHRRSDGGRDIEVFEASEALATGEVLSLEEKFLAGEGQNITPARYAPDAAERQRISDEVKKELHRVAKVLNIEGYARIDAFVRVRDNGAVEVIIIEVNSLPGMTPATCIFHQTALAGYTPYDFIDRILEYGKSRVAKQ
ncbi:D-alanine--D-alanine ligase [Hymenobacter koreensis]|uniref:D-alanine--D-alanine ligase n=1 Tax=Hymenobacter koreensis TaxID=1084523 RepID=A0ABP8IZU2_9BACT